MELQNVSTSVIPGINLAKNKDKISLFAFGSVTPIEPQIKVIGEQEIKIWETIPYEQVLDAIQWAINYILDDRTFISAPLNAIIYDIAICRYWSNIDCSEVDSLDFDAIRCYEFYDALQHFGIIDAVTNLIQPKQLQFFENNLRDTLNSLVAYRNSAAGIIESLQQKSGEDTLNLNKAMDIVNDDNQMANIRKVLELFGQEADAAMPETAMQDMRAAAQSAQEGETPQ